MSKDYTIDDLVSYLKSGSGRTFATDYQILVSNHANRNNYLKSDTPKSRDLTLLPGGIKSTMPAPKQSALVEGANVKGPLHNLWADVFYGGKTVSGYICDQNYDPSTEKAWTRLNMYSSPDCGGSSVGSFTRSELKAVSPTLKSKFGNKKKKRRKSSKKRKRSGRKRKSKRKSKRRSYGKAVRKSFYAN